MDLATEIAIGDARELVIMLVKMEDVQASF